MRSVSGRRWLSAAGRALEPVAAASKPSDMRGGGARARRGSAVSVMSQINPFTGAVLQGPHVQRQQAADKDRHLRRVQDQSRHAALTGDKLEHQVENAEAIQ